MRLESKEIQEILRLVEAWNLVFVGNELGPSLMDEAQLALLDEYGFDINPVEVPTVELAYKFGLLSEEIGDDRTKAMNYQQFRSYVGSGRFMPLTTAEENALNHLKLFHYQNVMNLTGKIKGDVGTELYEYNQSMIREYDIARDEGEKAIKQRDSVQELISNLGHKSGNWQRDHGRMADYVMHHAYDHGVADKIIEKFGTLAEVYKSVYQGACKHCVALYLTNGPGSEPRVFKVGELVANGTNIGRKTKDWRPVVGATHPWCRCTLHRKMPNTVWDAENNNWKVTRKPKVKRRSRAKVTIT